MSTEKRSEDYRDVLDPSHARKRRLRRAVVAAVLMLLLVVVVWRMDDEPAAPDEQAEVAPGEQQATELRPTTIPAEHAAPDDMPRAADEGLEGAQEHIIELPDAHVEMVTTEDEVADATDSEAGQVEDDAPTTAAAPSAGGGTLVHMGGYQALHAVRDRARILAEADYPLRFFRRIRVGPFDARSEANQALQQLRAEHGLDGMLTGGPSADGRWRVQVGVFTDQDNADRLVAKLEENGFGVEQAGRLELGPYESRDAAEQAVAQLRDHDIDASAAELRDVQ